jgi:hypothetical protein
MYEKRRSERLAQENEITIKIVSKGKLPPNKKIIYQISKDISSSGTRIRTNTFLSVDTLLKIQLPLKQPPRMITALGKVKWVRTLYADESFEVGLEFIDTSSETIKLLADYISQTQHKEIS